MEHSCLLCLFPHINPWNILLASFFMNDNHMKSHLHMPCARGILRISLPGID